MSNFKRGQSNGRRRYQGKNNSKRRFYGKKRSYRGGNRYRNPGLSLDPQLFVKKAVEEEVEEYEPRNIFADFDLDKRVKENIFKHGFKQPTAIQDKAIPGILEGRDLVGIANTGTGKTAAFLLPLITKVDRNRHEKVLIVTPTRELAAQIQNELRLFARGMGIYSVLCIGGVSINRQRQELSRRPNFVIGTPGRLKDLQKRRMLNLAGFGNVVLDEVDRMLDMGFIHDIKKIISFLPRERQSLFFSATMPEKTKEVMRQFLKQPITVSVKTGRTCENVDQDIVRVGGKDKTEVLHQLLIKEEVKKVLIFGRTKRGVNSLEQNLSKRGFKTVSIHGNKSQGQRNRALKMLKNNEAQIMVATDVAARGIDIDDISHVINYDVPESYDDYVHRIGRTGRAGKKGVALTFVR